MMARFALLLLLAACDRHGPWTSEAVMDRSMARLDADGDGRFEEPEFVHIAYRSTPFDVLDVNRDGQLDTRELQVQLLGQDPLTFDGLPEREPVSISLNPDVFHPYAYEVRVVRDLLLFLKEEALARDPSLSLPPDADIDAASAEPALDGPRTREVLARLEESWRALGLPFPARLATAPSPP